MFRTSVSEFTSLNSPARRGLVAELAVQCQKTRSSREPEKLARFDWLPVDETTPLRESADSLGIIRNDSVALPLAFELNHDRL